VKPEVGQRRENDREISAGLAGKKSGNVLNEDIPAGPYKLICDSGELVEQAGAGSVKSGAFPGDAEVLAGEAAADEIKTAWYPWPGLPPLPFGESVALSRRTSPRWFSPNHVAYVVVDGDAGEPLSEHSLPPRILLTEERMSKPSPLESQIEASDPAEKGTDIQSEQLHSPDRPARIIHPPASSAATGSYGENPRNGVTRQRSYGPLRGSQRIASGHCRP
jgi:hypothetical protein